MLLTLALVFQTTWVSISFVQCFDKVLCQIRGEMPLQVGRCLPKPLTSTLIISVSFNQNLIELQLLQPGSLCFALLNLLRPRNLLSTPLVSALR
jgi:hypothetical protein